MGRAPCCEKVGLNRGPWSREEDVRLVQYIREHGEGCWRTLPKAAGLLRCGKSCRLRWINYLRPDLKRGNITAEEERLIMDLHAHFGNRWSWIAARMPGRTDNEIKNYWNTHLKKRLRMMGLDPQTHKPLVQGAVNTNVNRRSNFTYTPNGSCALAAADADGKPGSLASLVREPVVGVESMQSSSLKIPDICMQQHIGINNNQSPNNAGQFVSAVVYNNMNPVAVPSNANNAPIMIYNGNRVSYAPGSSYDEYRPQGIPLASPNGSSVNLHVAPLIVNTVSSCNSSSEHRELAAALQTDNIQGGDDFKSSMANKLLQCDLYRFETPLGTASDNVISSCSGSSTVETPGIVWNSNTMTTWSDLFPTAQNAGAASASGHGSMVNAAAGSESTPSSAAAVQTNTSFLQLCSSVPSNTLLDIMDNEFFWDSRMDNIDIESALTDAEAKTPPEVAEADSSDLWVL